MYFIDSNDKIFKPTHTHTQITRIIENHIILAVGPVQVRLEASLVSNSIEKPAVQSDSGNLGVG